MEDRSRLTLITFSICVRKDKWLIYRCCSFKHHLILGVFSVFNSLIIYLCTTSRNINKWIDKTYDNISTKWYDISHIMLCLLLNKINSHTTKNNKPPNTWGFFNLIPLVLTRWFLEHMLIDKVRKIFKSLI